MKKVLLTLTADAGLAFASQAQDMGFGKGNVIVEGNLGFNSQDNKNTEVKKSSFNFSPKVGYFFTDKFAAGINFNVETTTEDQYDIDRKSTNNNVGVGLFGRYYFLELGSRFKTYTELNADYSNSKSELTVAGNTTDLPKTNNFGVNAGIGANYFLTDKVALNFAFANVIGFNTSKADVDGAKAVNEFGVNINQFNNFFNTARFGLTFKF